MPLHTITQHTVPPAKKAVKNYTQCTNQNDTEQSTKHTMARTNKKTVSKRRQLPKMYENSSTKVKVTWELGERMRLSSIDAFDAAEFLHSTDVRLEQRVADAKKADTKVQELYNTDGGPAFWSTADRENILNSLPDKHSHTGLEGVDDDLDGDDLMSTGDRATGDSGVPGQELASGSRGSADSGAQQGSHTAGGQDVGANDTKATKNAGDEDKPKKVRAKQPKKVAAKETSSSSA